MDRRSFEFMLATPSGRVDSVPEEVLLDFWPVGGLAVEVTSVFVDLDTKVNKRFDDHVRDDVRREAPDERGFIDVTELAETLTDERRRASLLVLRSDTDDGSIVPENAVKFSEEEEQKGRDRIAALTSNLRNLFLGHAGEFAIASDRASSEFEAIMRDVYGLEASMDSTLTDLASLVMDAEAFGMMLSATKHLPERVKEEAMLHVLLDSYEQLKIDRKAAANREQARRLLNRNANLVAGEAEGPTAAVMRSMTRK